MASLASPIHQQSSLPYIMPSSATGLEHVEEQYKTYLVENLEALLIGHPTHIIWPDSLKNIVSDTLLRGRFKYRDENSRIHRVIHHSTLTIGKPSRTAPTEPEEDHPFEQKKIFCIYNSVRLALQLLSSTKAFQADETLLEELLIAWSQLRFECNPLTPNSLGAISDLILDVVTLSTRPALQIIDVLITSITGVPCIIPSHLPAGVGTSHRDVNLIVHSIICTIVFHLLEASAVKNVEPGSRWKLTHMTRLCYLQKVLNSHDQCSFTLEMLYTLSKLDMCHAVLESGVAFKALGKKICYCAPISLTLAVTSAVADVHATEDSLRFLDPGLEMSNLQTKRYLTEKDRDDWQKNTLDAQYGEWTSISETAFALKTLTDFVTREAHNKKRVAANAHGDVLFYVDIKGPWRRPRDLGTRLETYQELMKGTVQGYHIENPVRFQFCGPKSKKYSKSVDKAPIESMPASSELFVVEDFEDSTSKPKTLNAVINGPGRVLVKRKGIRGSGGRFIMATILALGILSIVLNFAKRDNWLEIAFDGAQVMSLLAGMAVIVIYIINGTLTSTLDWLSGQTEVTDEVQLARVLGVTLDELKVACTYEKEFLFWLSNVNSSFCPAGKYGTIMFSEPFDMKNAARHVEYCSVIDEGRGLWLLQEWAFLIEKDGDVGIMVKVPHEDRVYVDGRHITKFGGR